MVVMDFVLVAFGSTNGCAGGGRSSACIIYCSGRCGGSAIGRLV